MENLLRDELKIMNKNRNKKEGTTKISKDFQLCTSEILKSARLLEFEREKNSHNKHYTIIDYSQAAEIRKHQRTSLKVPF